ncbi:MAG TPA: LLM class flavin-dependent oxidoreductase, partial [Longimicrobium sp.]|nr:LLM class flavin-dependent oxidoreductase [Longimicrobium sp.]
MDFGIMFFSSQADRVGSAQYRLVIDAAKFADEHGFSAVWTPERHFHEFGGIFPNPALTSAALAMVTRNLRIRAGSLISPLHDVLRIAEEWAVVDNLSDGRVEVAFGSGWNVNDF